MRDHKHEHVSGQGESEEGDTRSVAGHDPAPADERRSSWNFGERYKIESHLGKGGFGSVFRAYDARLDRTVAIKVLLRHADDTENSILHEASKAASVRHENLVVVYDVMDDRPEPFVVMEWVDGQPLDQQWGRTLPQRVSSITEVASGLHALHSAGLIHCDIKPANILIDRDNRLRIVDFGLAKQASLHTPNRRAVVGGTPGSSAPEQFEPGAPIRKSADVWSLGVLLFHAITGRPPYDGGTAEDVITASKQQDPPLPESLAPKCPPDLQRVCLKALERDPLKRYRDAGEFLADLSRYSRGEPVLARPSMLEKGFVGGLERQIRELEDWQRLGLISRHEAGAIKGSIHRLIAPETDWVLESRQLTFSRVLAHIGVWFAVLAVVLGVNITWDDLGRWGYLLAGSVTLGMLAAAIIAVRSYAKRLAILLPVGAILTTTGFTWLVLKRSRWLEPDPSDPRELFAIFEMEPTSGSGNLQMMLVSLLCMTLCGAARLVVGSTAFTMLGLFALTVLLLAMTARYGAIDPDSIFVFSQLALGVAPLCIALLSTGYWLDSPRNGATRPLRGRVEQRDAAIIVALGVAQFFSILTVFAFDSPNWLVFASQADWPARDESLRAFLLNGLALFTLSAVFDRRGPSSRLCAKILRWLVPIHVLGSLIALESAEAFDARGAWLAALGGAALLLSLLSIPKQWKPFLFSGLLGIAVAFVLVFRYINDVERDLDLDLSRVRVSVAISAALISGGLLLLSWRLPDWKVTRRLTRWKRRRTASMQITPPDILDP
ncbi:MAG: serine/threonine-protein kinase [Planctomycetota bacterium]